MNANKLSCCCVFNKWLLEKNSQGVVIEVFVAPFSANILQLTKPVW